MMANRTACILIVHAEICPPLSQHEYLVALLPWSFCMYSSFPPQSRHMIARFIGLSKWSLGVFGCALLCVYALPCDSLVTCPGRTNHPVTAGGRHQLPLVTLQG